MFAAILFEYTVKAGKSATNPGTLPLFSKTEAEMGTADAVRQLLRRRRELLQQREAVIGAAIAAAVAGIDQELGLVEQQLQVIQDGGEGTVLLGEGDTGLIDVTITPLPKRHPDAGKISNKLLAWVLKGGPLPFKDVARDLYGEDSKANRQKVHSALHNLKKRGIIEPASDGGYSLAPPKKKRGRKPKPAPTGD